MKKNFVYNLIYQILILILPLVTVPYVSRVLGADGVGKYSYTYSIAYYFMICAMLGLNNYGNRAIAKVRDNKEELSKEFCGIYAFQLISSITMVVSYILYIILFNKEYKLIASIQILYVLSSVFDINWFFFGIEKFKLTITRNTLIKVLSLILIFLFVKQREDVWIYTLILAGSTLFSNIVLFSFLKKYVKFVGIKKEDVVKHIKPCFTLFLPVIAVSIYNVISKIILGSLSEISEVGYYENAVKIIQVPLSIVTALGTVMLPRTSNLISKNKDVLVKNTLSKSMTFVMFLVMPMVFGLLAIGKDFSIIFFGSEFLKTGYILKILVIDIIFISWGNVIRTQYLIPKEKDKEYTISAILGAIVNVITNLILVPKFASIGATIGNVFAEFSVVLFQSWAVRKELNLKRYFKDSVNFIIKAFIMYIGILLIGNIISKYNIFAIEKYNVLFKLIIQVITGGIIYIGLNIKYIYINLDIKNFIYKIKERRD